MSHPNQNSLLWVFFFFNYAFGEGFAAQQVETFLFSVIATKMLKEAGSWTSSEAQGWSLSLETAEMVKRAKSVVFINGLKGREKSEGRLKANRGGWCLNHVSVW